MLSAPSAYWWLFNSYFLQLYIFFFIIFFNINAWLIHHLVFGPLSFLELVQGLGRWCLNKRMVLMLALLRVQHASRWVKYISFLNSKPHFFLWLLETIEYVFILIIWISLDQRRTVEGAGTARGRRQLTRISPQRLQGSSDYLSRFFHLYIVIPS